MVTVNENLKGLRSYSGLAAGKESGLGAGGKTNGKECARLSEFYRDHALDNTGTVIVGVSEMRSSFADEADQYLELD